jgi:hypothetical protein
LPSSRPPEWSTFRFSVAADLVRSGVNGLEILWPSELADGREEIEQIACDLEHGRPIALLPVFAEIFSLTAVERRP